MKRWRHLQHATADTIYLGLVKNSSSYLAAHNPPLLISHFVQAEWRITTSIPPFPERLREQGSTQRDWREGGGGERQQCVLHSAGHLSAVRAITAPPSVKCLKCALACSTVASCPCDPARLALGDSPYAATNRCRQCAVKINMLQFCSASVWLRTVVWYNVNNKLSGADYQAAETLHLTVTHWYKCSRALIESHIPLLRIFFSCSGF